MRNKTRTILFLLTISMCSLVHAIDKQVLADTLTSFASERAYVEDVRVSRVRVKNQFVWVYTNKVLGQLSLQHKEIQALRTLVSKMVLGHVQGKVSIYSDDYELGELVTSRHKHRPHKQHYTLPQGTAWVENLSSPSQTKQGLAGKHIALWGSHGLYYQQSTDTWRWQRAKLWSTVEDLYTSSYTMPYLVPMLENAGAIVVQARERDTQTYEVVVDDDEARGEKAMRREGDEAMWVKVEGRGWGHTEGDLLEGENPFEKGGYMQTAASDEEMRYTPTLPDGEYAVYVSYQSLPNSTDKARYTVMHKGEKTLFSINQKIGGGTWVYLGTFAFGQDAEKNYVSVAGSAHGKEVVTTDAVKFGGGMGNIARYPTPADSAARQANEKNAITSSMPRYTEAARYWMQYAGIPDSIYNYTESQNDYVDDYVARGRWVNYLAGGSAANPKEAGLRIPIHAALALHTDAGIRDEVVGTLVIYKDHDDEKNKQYPTGKSRILNRDLGDYMQTQIVEDMRASYAPDWTRRELDNASYAEARHPKVPTVLLELLSHQNMTDMQYGLDPRVRFVVSRAIYKALLRFIHEQYGTTYVVQPLPVREMKMRVVGERTETKSKIAVSWKATEDKLEPTAKPSYYVVYTRKDDGDWDNGVRIAKAEYTLEATPGIRYDIRVAAGNEGGESMKSEILSAYIAPEAKGEVLVVNGFTRVSGPEWWADSTYAGIKPYSHAVPYGKGVSYIGEVYDYDRKKEWISDDDCGWGMCHSDHMGQTTAGNTFDYTVMHGKVLAKMGYSYVSSSIDGLDSIVDYDAVDLILGKQKTTILRNDTSYKCIPQELQQILTNYLQGGGRLLLSGAYIASDMRSSADKAFVKKQLHYTYASTHASRTGKVRVEREMEKGIYDFRTEPNAEVIHTENADGLCPADGSVVVARFPETNVAAAIGHDASVAGGSKTLCWSLMLESAYDFEKLYEMSMQWILRD